MPNRQEVFEREISDFDERQLPRVLDFKQHRFVTIERDTVTGSTFVRGHKSLRGACDSLSRTVAGAERFIPERVLDLDTGEMHELDVFAFVAPRHVEAVAVMLPRLAAEAALNAVNASNAGAAMEQARVLLAKAIERRSE